MPSLKVCRQIINPKRESERKMRSGPDNPQSGAVSFFSSTTLSFIFPRLFFLLPVILTTSRNHEDKSKNPAVHKGGQGLVVVRVFSSPYGSSMFTVPRLQGCLLLTYFFRVFKIFLIVLSACERWVQYSSTLLGAQCHFRVLLSSSDSIL